MTLEIVRTNCPDRGSITQWLRNGWCTYQRMMKQINQIWEDSGSRCGLTSPLCTRQNRDSGVRRQLAYEPMDDVDMSLGSDNESIDQNTIDEFDDQYFFCLSELMQNDSVERMKMAEYRVLVEKTKEPKAPLTPWVICRRLRTMFLWPEEYSNLSLIVEKSIQQLDILEIGQWNCQLIWMIFLVSVIDRVECDLNVFNEFDCNYICHILLDQLLADPTLWSYTIYNRDDGIQTSCGNRSQSRRNRWLLTAFQISHM